MKTELTPVIISAPYFPKVSANSVDLSRASSGSNPTVPTDILDASVSAPASPTTANLAKLPALVVAPAVILKAKPSRLQSILAGVRTAMATVSQKAQAIVSYMVALCAKANDAVTQTYQAVKNRVSSFKFVRATANELPGQVLADEAAAANMAAKANKMPTSKLPCPNGNKEIQAPIEVTAAF